MKCIKFLSNINSGHFRATIWHWIKYTTIKPSAKNNAANLGAQDQQSNYTDGSAYNFVGFIQCVQ